MPTGRSDGDVSDVPAISDVNDLHARAALPQNSGPYTLYRADTHGTEWTVVPNVSENFAQAAVSFFERREHHQGYWYRVPECLPG